MQITATTTDREIEQATKQEIVEALFTNPASNAGQKYKKDELALTALSYRDTCKVNALEKQLENAEEYAHTLQQEWATPNIHKAIENLAMGLQSQVNDATKTIQDFADRVAKDPLGVGDTIRWHADSMYEATAIRRQLAGLLEFLIKQKDDQTMTSGEILDNLKLIEEQYHDRCLRGTGYEATSTNPLSCLQDCMEFKATQTKAKLLTYAVKAFSQDLETKDSMEGRSLWVW